MKPALILALLGGLLAFPLLAQDQQQEPSAPEGVEVPAEDPVELDTESEPVSPGNYQASEQISDDLSVSFPVDI